MNAWNLAGSTALSLLFVAGAAQAAVTPEEVWANWKSMIETSAPGLAVGSETREGDTLVVKNVTLTLDQDGGTSSGQIAELRFRDMGDGTVEVTMPQPMTLEGTSPAAEGMGAAGFTLNLAMPGMAATASGTVEDMTYAIAAPEVRMHAEGGAAEGENQGQGVFDLAILDLSGSYAVTAGEPGPKVSESLTAKSAEFAGSVTGTADGSDVAFKMAFADLSGSFSGILMGAEAMADMAAALKAGYMAQGDMTYGAGTYEITTGAADMATKVFGAVGGGRFAVSMDQGRLAIGTGSQNVTVNVEGMMSPVQGEAASYAETSFDLAMPMAAGEAPQDFAMKVVLTDFKLAEGLWAMFDPGAALPHDPASMILDVKGAVTLMADLIPSADPAAMEMMMPPMPNSVELVALGLKALGAEITGQGAVTFDPAQMGMMGMPAPVGKLEFKAQGINALIDKLVAAGLVPQDQAMQGQMMLGMFAQPGEGEDTLVSTIEFKGTTMSINGMEMPMQ